MNIVGSVIIVILMLGVLASLHELGHFWVARLLKIKVYEVSLFVGPKLLRWKRNDVDFSIRLVPLGAYVRFNDVDPEGYVKESDDPSLLANQPRYKRLIVSIAGPLMNLILGVLIFAGIFIATGYVSLNIGKPVDGTQTGAAASQYTVGDTIEKVNGVRVISSYDFFFELDSDSNMEDMVLTLRSKETGKTYDVTLSPVLKNRPMLLITVESMKDNSEHSGWLVHEVEPEQNDGKPILKEGDYVTYINGVSVEEDGFYDYLYSITDEYVTVTYIRDGVTYEEKMKPAYTQVATSRGIVLTQNYVRSFPEFLSAFGYAAKMPAAIVILSVRGIREIIAGKVKAYNLVSGPIGITTMVNDVVQDEKDTTSEKVLMLIMLSAIISIAIAFSNLLPIPGLDGIQIILIAVEMIIGRKLSEKAEGILTIVGFVLIILLLLFAFVSDILRIIFGY